MNKKVLVIIIVVVVVIAAAIGAYLVFASNNYSLYSNAFKKTFDVNSMELATTVNASIRGGAKITSTGNFKLKDMDTSPQFVNTMTIGDMTVTQFSDGNYVYTDDGNNKNKVSIGGEPTPKEQQRDSDDFSMEAYISEFSGLLDASKIRQLSAMEPVAEKYVDKIETVKVSDGKKFIVTLLPQAVDELIDNFLSENLSDPRMSPTVELNSITYTATVSSDYVTEIVFSLDMQVTAPGDSSSKTVVVDFIIEPVNPGRDVRFNLPSTDGF